MNILEVGFYTLAGGGSLTLTAGLFTSFYASELTIGADDMGPEGWDRQKRFAKAGKRMSLVGIGCVLVGLPCLETHRFTTQSPDHRITSPPACQPR